MKYTLQILRRNAPGEKPVWKAYELETETESVTVATALSMINKTLPAEEKIMWDCSCLQKKCGACAMLINGKPGLACARRLADYGDHIRLEPLKKFPLVEDLIVDRGIMSENLKMMEVYLKGEALVNEKRNELSYEASRCLQCGCCLEVCPNYMANNGFTGMAGAMPLSRIINELNKSDLKEVSKTYNRYVYEGCGKSLACVDICPAGIKIEDLLVNSNAIAVWKRYIKD